MKKFILICFLFAIPAYSAEDYAFTVIGTSTNRDTQVGQIELGRIQWNAGVCTRGNLPITCSQAEACVALNVIGGAACTATDAIAANARIYPNTLAGRNGFVANIMVRSQVAQFVSIQKTLEAAQWLIVWQAKSRAEKDTWCQQQVPVFPVGCDPF